MSVYNRLKRLALCRRIIEILIIFLAIGMTFLFRYLKEKNKVVEIYGQPVFTYEVVTYPKTYTGGISAAIVVISFMAVVFIADLIFSKVYHTKIDGEYVVIYNVLCFYKLIVNGKIRSTMVFKGGLKAKLMSGVKIMAVPEAIRSFRIAFSDKREDILI